MYNFVCESERKYENTPIYNGCIAGSTLATRDVHAYVFYDIKPLRVTRRLTGRSVGGTDDIGPRRYFSVKMFSNFVDLTYSSSL